MPFLIDDLGALREGLKQAETAGTRRGALWNAVRRCARSSPVGFPWFTPFVALVTGERRDIDAAAGVLRSYVARLDPLAFSSGLQYHFWCFAFPHAKWCLYFQWLRFLDAFAAEEARRIGEELLAFHFVNFLYGLRTKPEPECADNQVLSLSLSCALAGELFSSGEQTSGMAAVLREEGMRRLPVIIGGIPRSGYTGEGSDYMDCVIGPAIPLAVELLERTVGDADVLHREFPPSGVTPIQVLRMVAHEWLPGGLLLPWDNYGYIMGIRSPLAWAGARTGERVFLDILGNEAVWSHDIGIGWAYDDLPWTLAWWPLETEGTAVRAAVEPLTAERSGVRDWFEPETGGALWSRDSRTCLVQIWDPAEPRIPVRSHVNPNAVVLAANGVPISVDGTPDPSSHAFELADAWRTVRQRIGTDHRYNFGAGCAGAHSVLLVDGWDGMRVLGAHRQLRESGAGPGPALWADVTPVYAEKWPDVVTVRRRSRLHEDRFFTVEDLAVFRETHEVRSRFLVRPELIPADRGVMIRTSEGVGLQIVAALGSAQTDTRRIDGFPDRLEGECRLADFVSRGREIRSLFVLFPSSSRSAHSIAGDWLCIPDDSGALSREDAMGRLDRDGIAVGFHLPAHMLADLPVARRWWYRKTFPVLPGIPAWLRLPRSMVNPALWIDGRRIDLSAFARLSKLVQPEVLLAPDRGAEIEVVVRCDVPVSHFEGGGWGTTGLNGAPALCLAADEERMLDAQWDHDVLTVRTTARAYRVACPLMEED
jgi:hypothetical protein